MIHSYPWYPSDWLNSETRLRLSLAARSVYRDLLDHCWSQGDLPKDERVLAGLAGATVQEFAKVWPTIADRFTEIDGRLHHHKVDEKRPDLLKWREQKRSAGQASVAAKRQRALEQPLNARCNETSTELQPPSSSSSSPTSSSSSKKQTPTPLAAPTQPEREIPDLTEAFAELWDNYPKKGRTKRVACEHYYTEIMEGLTGEALNRRINLVLNPVLAGGAWAESAKWAAGYVQNLDTYLAQRQWDEEPEAAGDAMIAGMSEREKAIKRQQEIDDSWARR